MKKILVLILSLVLCIFSSYGQNNNVIKFLGIPIDGTKTEMISNLKSKGFVYNSKEDCYDGKFNGQNVHVSISTNGNKVDRLCIDYYKTNDDSSFISAYNTLLKQFDNNEKYISSNNNEYIKDDERIDINYTLYNKTYEANFGYIEGTNSIEDITCIVWFRLIKIYNEYHIALYYENLNNRPNGEDL